MLFRSVCDRSVTEIITDILDNASGQITEACLVIVPADFCAAPQVGNVAKTIDISVFIRDDDCVYFVIYRISVGICGRRDIYAIEGDLDIGMSGTDLHSPGEAIHGSDLTGRCTESEVASIIESFLVGCRLLVKHIVSVGR